jgi:hypothetical protein
MKFHVVETFTQGDTVYIPFGAKRDPAAVKTTDGGEELKIDDSGQIDLTPKQAKKLLDDGSIVRGSAYDVLREIHHDGVCYVPADYDLRGFAVRKNTKGEITGYETRSGGSGKKIQVDVSGLIELTPVDAEQLLHIGAIARPRKRKTQ